MHQALYRKWRPQTFSDVCGQEHITSILKYETEHHKFSHAYLFCGSRGTGKTTCAKILAKAVNCEAPVEGNPCNQCAACRSIDAGIATDVLEMDAASNNGVDNIRDIRDEVVYSPSALKYRVYIVDEVHMLSGSAFNALLKTLEEPPAHVVFILATTELHKLPSTIISRCQRFDFRRIATDVLTSRLVHIADREGIEYDADALRALAKLAQGGMRDAISLLELCAGTRQRITSALVDQTVGSGGRDALEQTVRAIAASNFDGIFATVDDVVRSSRDVAVFWQDLQSYYRDMLVMRTTSVADRYLDLTENESARLKKTAELFSKETLLHHCRIMDEAFYAMQKAGAAKRLVAEMALLRLCDTSLDTSTDAILSRLSKLETAVAAGVTFRSHEIPNMEREETISDEKPQSEATEPLKEVHYAPEIIPEPEQSMKLIRGWNEIVEQAAAGDNSVLPFMKMAKALMAPDGRVYVKFPNDFAKSMVDRPAMREAVRASLCMALSKNLSEKDLIFAIMEKDEVYTDLDELEF
ncbi:MAG: DNA polymerase III subunit gamma/tau [Clostridia bacterium]|nr:DNA polymerase III subunit gamma/tau [Clostridia bacterium]